MAARRLLIVMLVLLGISSVIAVMVPDPDRRDPASEGSSTTGETGTTGTSEETSGSEGERDGGYRSEASPETTTESVSLDAGKKAEVKVKPGSRLVLSVNSKEGSLVEIEGLGLTGFADPYAPAVFDVILPSQPGRFQVRVPGEDSRAAALITSRSGD